MNPFPAAAFSSVKIILGSLELDNSLTAEATFYFSDVVGFNRNAEVREKCRKAIFL